MTGDLGSGKSSVARKLCDKLNAQYYSTGVVQRELANKLGISTLEMNICAETDPSIDQHIDGIFASLAEKDENFVVDSRMAWHFLPDSFKVMLKVDPTIGAERIVADNRRQGEGYTDMAEALDMIAARKNSERERFLKTYNVDTEDDSNYDLVIDTSSLSTWDVFEEIMTVIG